MNYGTKISHNGIGFFGLLTYIFIVLKLCGAIDWSWWWVSAPAWAIPAILVSATLLTFAFVGVVVVLELVAHSL